MSLKIFSVGGTIDKIYFDAKSDYQIGDPRIDSILKEANVTIDYDVQSIMRKDSLDMDDADRDQIHRFIAADEAQQIILTHGTDSMVETALALRNIADKTIVLTGSMQPASLKVSDAAFNVGCAITAAQCLPAGVYIAMNGRIFNPETTHKNVSMNLFE